MNSLFENKYYVITILIIAIRLLLDFLYINYVQPSYEYWGFIANPTLSTYFVSFLTLLPSIYLILPYFYSEKFVVSNIIILIYFIGFVPTTTLIACDSLSNGFILSFITYWYLTLYLTNRITISEFDFICLPDWMIICIGLFFSFIIIYISGTYANFRFSFSLDNVYELRTESRSYDIPKLLVYLWSASRALLPIIVSFCLMKKKYLYSLFFVLIIILNFSIDGLKSTLFSVVICVFLFFFLKKDIKDFYPLLIALLIMFGIMEYQLWGFSSITEVIIRRNFILTSFLDLKYYEEVFKNGPLYWTYSIDGRDIAFLIGDKYFGKDEMRANNGLFSDAYMNLGYWGCIIYPIIYAYLFNYVDKMLSQTNRGIVLLFCFLWAYKLRGATLTTGLITHGIAAAIILLALLPPSNTWEEKEDEYIIIK